MSLRLGKLDVPAGSGRIAYAHELDRQLALQLVHPERLHGRRKARAPRTSRTLIALWVAVGVVALAVATFAGVARSGAGVGSLATLTHDSRVHPLATLARCVDGAEVPPCAGPDYLVLAGDPASNLPLRVVYPDTGETFGAPAPTMPTCALATSAGPCAWDTGEASLDGYPGHVYVHTPDGAGGCYEVIMDESDDSYPVHYPTCTA
jgi:hypothetical protein